MDENEERMNDFVREKVDEAENKLDTVFAFIIDALKKTYNSGKKDGVDRGCNESYEAGYNDGYKEGFAEGRKGDLEKKYQQGLNDAWEAAKFIAEGGQGVYDIFGFSTTRAIFNANFAADAVRQIKEWKENKSREPKWIEHHENGTIDYKWQCSSCKQFSPNATRSAYCPSCGAKMSNPETLYQLTSTTTLRSEPTGE